jgi:hypothetical protein
MISPWHVKYPEPLAKQAGTWRGGCCAATATPGAASTQQVKLNTTVRTKRLIAPPVIRLPRPDGGRRRAVILPRRPRVERRDLEQLRALVVDLKRRVLEREPLAQQSLERGP